MENKGTPENEVTEEKADSQINEAQAAEAGPGRQGEDHFRTIFDLVNDAIFIHDVETGQILDVNQRMCEMYGLTREEALKLTADQSSSGVPPYTAEEAYNWLRKATTGAPQLFEWHAKHKDGHLFWVEVNIRKAAIGGKDKLLVTVRDISERKKAEAALKESEKRYGILFETIRDGFVSARMDGSIIEANPAFQSMVGYTAEELCRMTYEDITPSKWHSFEREIIEEQVLKRDYSDFYEKEYVRRDGTIFPVEIRVHLLRNEAGEPEKMWGFARDITARKEAEGLLQEYEKAVEGSQDMIATVDRDYRYCLANTAFVKYRGMSTEQVIGRTVREIVGDDLFENLIRERLDECFLGKVVRYEMKRSFPRIGERDLLISYFPIQDFGEVDRVVEIIRDITGQRSAEAALKESEEKYRNIFENAVEGIFQTMPGGRYISANPALAKMLGYDSSREMIEAITDIEEQQYVNPEDRRRFLELLDKQGVARGLETQVYRKNGDKVWISLNARAVRGPEGETAYYEGTCEDISLRKRVEETLKESEETLRILINATQETLLLIDGEGTVVVANEIAAERLGTTVENIIGTCLYDSFPPDLALRRREAFEKAALMAESIYFTDMRAGRVYETYAYPVLAADGKVSRIAIFAHDITQRAQAEKEKEQLESRLRQSQKLEALGTMAGGIAHDFNNILTTIIGYGGLLRMDLQNEVARQYADQILASSQKAAVLTQSLLAFSRKQALDLKPRKINEIMGEAENLLKMLITEDIRLRVNRADPDVTVEADLTQMAQVLMNLATNARDAMPGGGTITIDTKIVHFDDDFIHEQGFGKEGDYALISVADTGMGMDDETRRKIFEPFFTTKEVGKGTGLGLSIVYGIINQHDGYVTVSSEKGKGTRFDMYLPIVSMPAVEKTVAEAEVKGGGETILLAEDNDDVRRLAAQVLSDKGYRVIAAVDGDDAVRRFMEHKDEIDLLLLDVVMPGKNGKEAYDEIGKSRPGIRVLFTSGYTRDIVLTKGVANEEINYISKPLVPNDLLRKVRETLDR